MVDEPMPGTVLVRREENDVTHVHIGQNIPGYLPEGDIYCTDDLGAVETDLKCELERQRDFYYEGCPNNAAENCTCGWCKVGDEVAEDLKPESHVWPELAAQGEWGAIYTPPEGAPIHIWATKVPGEAADCEIWQEQDQ